METTVGLCPQCKGGTSDVTVNADGTMEASCSDCWHRWTLEPKLKLAEMMRQTPDGGIPQPDPRDATIADQAAEIARLREALGPFAKFLIVTITQPEDIPEGQPGRQYGSALFQWGDEQFLFAMGSVPNSYGVAMAGLIISCVNRARAALGDKPTAPRESTVTTGTFAGAAHDEAIRVAGKQSP